MLVCNMHSLIPRSYAKTQLLRTFLALLVLDQLKKRKVMVKAHFLKGKCSLGAITTVSGIGFAAASLGLSFNVLLPLKKFLNSKFGLGF